MRLLNSVLVEGVVSCDPIPSQDDCEFCMRHERDGKVLSFPIKARRSICQACLPGRSIRVVGSLGDGIIMAEHIEVKA
jgi:tRNA(Ile2) C34 agmatinyltransferase TiaS